MPSVLKPFKSFLKDYRDMLSWMVGLALTNSVADLGCAAGPPWPERVTTVYITVAFAWVCIIWAFAIWRKKPEKVIGTLLKRSCSTTLATILIYMILRAFFVVDADGRPGFHVDHHQEARGFVTLPSTDLLYKTDGMSPDEVLAGNLNNPELVWKPWTVRTVRAGLLITWIFLFSALSTSIASVILYLEVSEAHAEDMGNPGSPKKPKPKPAKKKTPKTTDTR